MKKHENQGPLTHHILPTASNLLGICFVILSFVKIGEKAEKTVLDECIIIPIILFLIASVLSYFSMRSNDGRPKIERMADLIFMLGLLSLSVISISLVFEFL